MFSILPSRKKSGYTTKQTIKIFYIFREIVRKRNSTDDQKATFLNEDEVTIFYFFLKSPLG